MSNIITYKFGILAPIENAGIVNDQLWKAQCYRNILTEIEIGRRNAYRGLLSSNPEVNKLELEMLEKSNEISDLNKSIKQKHSNSRSRSTDKNDKDLLNKMRLDLKILRMNLKNAKNTARESSVFKEDILNIRLKANELICSAREYSGLYGGTYQLVEECMDKVRKMPYYDDGEPNDPTFKRWKNEGNVGIQIYNGVKKPLITKNIFIKNNLCFIDPIDTDTFISETKRCDRIRKSKTFLYFRIKSDDKGKPIFAKFPIILHRPFPDPENPRITNIAIHKRLIGVKEVWEATFSIDISKCIPLSKKYEGILAYDIGWREMKDEITGELKYIRLGMFRGIKSINDKIDNTNFNHEPKLPLDIIKSLNKADEIQSIRDKEFNIAKQGLIDFKKNNIDICPKWFLEKTKTLSYWKSIGALRSLLYFWKKNRFNGDNTVIGISGKWDKFNKTVNSGYGLLGWFYHDTHLFNWEANQRSKSHKKRREYYRILARKLANQYEKLILEDFDLTEVSKKADVLDEDDHRGSRSNRTLVAPSEFREALINAFGKNNRVLIDPKNTSKKCYLCGSLETLDHTRIIHKCSNCEQEWDREMNATANQLKDGCEHISAGRMCGIARNNKKVNKSGGIKETRQEARARGKREKKEREETARKVDCNAAESLDI